MYLHSVLNIKIDKLDFLFQKPILMQSTNQLLTERELKYANRRFKNNRFMVRGLWPAYLLVVLAGVPLVFVYDESFWVGIGLILFGIIGAIFFRRFSKQTTFELVQTVEIHTGKLNKRIVGSGRYQHYRVFLDDYLLETPDGLEYYMTDLVEKYKGQKVEALLAVCEQTKNQNVHRHITPLKIEKDICIESAIKNHGTGFLRKAKYRLYFDITMAFILFSIVTMTIFFTLDSFDIANTPLFIILFIPGLYFVFTLYFKLVPKNEIELKEKLKCTCE